VKEFGFEQYPLELLRSDSSNPPTGPLPDLKDWKVLTKSILVETDQRTRLAMVFYKDLPIAFAMKLNPSSTKKMAGHWSIRKNGIPGLTAYISSKTDKEALQQLDSILS
jgi:hypothetical protein